MTRFQHPIRASIPKYGRYLHKDFALAAPYFYIERIADQTARACEDNHAHAHPNLYQMSWVSKGTGNYHIESGTWPLRAGHYYLLAPGVVHVCSEREYLEGYVMHFTPAFLSTVIPNLPQLGAELRDLHYRIALGAKDQEATADLFRLLFEEFKQHGVNELVRQYLKSILLIFQRQDTIVQVGNESGGYDALFSRFMQALQKHVCYDRSLSFYTELLHASVRQLDHSCKAVNSLTATQTIRQVILNKAKDLLRYSNKTIAEIAEELGFSDVGYFRKYVRRHEGVSASTYRNRLQGEK